MRLLGVNTFLFVISFLMGIQAWRCQTLRCVINPQRLKLWYHHIEVQAETVRVSAGTDVSITCDGACVGALKDPLLRWYGPNRLWIGNELRHSRRYIQRSFSGQHQKLHITDARLRDGGLYYCRGWLGKQRGWDLKKVRLIVESVPTPKPPPIDLPVRSTTDRIAQTTRKARIVTTVTETRPTTRSTIKTTIPDSTISDSNSTSSYTPSEATDTCSPPSFQCGTGECLDVGYVCDSFPDCSDGSDERDCGVTQCGEGQTACLDGHGCVLSKYVCDGISHCKDNSDERSVVCQHSNDLR